jgi:hypothetical protein
VTEPKLTFAAKEAIREYMIKLLIPSGAALAVVSFGLGFLINDVARKDAYSAAFLEANRTVLDTVGRVSQAESEASRASVVLKDALVVAERIKAADTLSRSDEQIARIAKELAGNREFLGALGAVRVTLGQELFLDYEKLDHSFVKKCPEGAVLTGWGYGSRNNDVMAFCRPLAIER